MMDLGQRQAIRDHRVSELLVPVHDDVSGIEQCKRRSKNPSLKRPVGPVAPE